MQDITTVGVYLAKEVFAVCMLDQTGAVVYSNPRRSLHAASNIVKIVLQGKVCSICFDHPGKCPTGEGLQL